MHRGIIIIANARSKNFKNSSDSSLESINESNPDEGDYEHSTGYRSNRRVDKRKGAEGDKKA